MTFHNRYTFFMDLCVQGCSNKNKKHKTYFKICVLDYFLKYNRFVWDMYIWINHLSSFILIGLHN